jgi:hypothetical protein
MRIAVGWTKRPRPARPDRYDRPWLSRLGPESWIDNTSPTAGVPTPAITARPIGAGRDPGHDGDEHDVGIIDRTQDALLQQPHGALEPGEALSRQDRHLTEVRAQAHTDGIGEPTRRSPWALSARRGSAEW